MKMTMHIDEELLARVIDAYGYASKTEAVDSALREMDRRHRMRIFREEGLGLTPEELGEAVDPDYDVMAFRVAESKSGYGQGKGKRGGGSR